MFSSLSLRLLARGVGAGAAGPALPCAVSYYRSISTACAASAAAAGMSASSSASATSICHRRGDCQRRYASSKPPADGNATARRDGIDTSSSSSSKAKNAAHAEEGSGVNSSAAAGKQVQGRRRGRKSNAATAANANKGKMIMEKYNLPSVPSTQHVHPNDIHVASFFSIHRPISITSSIPQFTNPDIFNAIFTKKSGYHHRHNSSSVISTLNSAVQHFEIATPDANGKTHLDSETITLDGDSHDIQSQLHQFYKPFSPPAPPVPRKTTTDAEFSADKEDAAAIEAANPVSRSYSSVLTIRESKHGDGHTTYEAHTTPFVQIEEKETPSQHSNEQQMEIEEPSMDESAFTGITENNTTPIRFLERMRERQMRFDAHRQSMSNMYAISVRRQRKLKMKKHKHKKLLRRTRNLRRKMDKA